MNRCGKNSACCRVRGAARNGDASGASQPGFPLAVTHWTVIRIEPLYHFWDLFLSVGLMAGTARRSWTLWDGKGRHHLSESLESPKGSGSFSRCEERKQYSGAGIHLSTHDPGLAVDSRYSMRRSFNSSAPILCHVVRDAFRGHCQFCQFCRYNTRNEERGDQADVAATQAMPRARRRSEGMGKAVSFREYARGSLEYRQVLPL